MLSITVIIAVVFSPSAQADPSEYGFQSVSVSRTTSQAGAHPDLTIAFALKTDPASPSDAFGHKEPYAHTRDLKIDLPPGLSGNPNAVSTCTTEQLATVYTEERPGCPQDSQVGVTAVDAAGIPFHLTEPIYNMETPTGNGTTVARLGFLVATLPYYINIHLRSNNDYGLTASLEGLLATQPLVSAMSTIWGVPAASSHDTQRLTAREAFPEAKSESPPRSSGLTPQPFMTNPTRCGAPQKVDISADTYEIPNQFVTATAFLTETSGCGLLSFEPSLSVTPTSHEAASPSGLDADLVIPQNEDVNGLTTSQLRYAEVTLPEGVTIASGAADGLQSCSAEEVGLGTLNAAACPNASKIGSAEFDVPALSRVIDGSIYQRTPVKGDLFGIWLVTDELGVHVKIPGVVHPDPVTGQLTTVFEGTAATEGNPQVPLREFRLHFKGGPRGVLATPSKCGIYQTHYEFTPWSGAAPAVGDTPMTIGQGCNTGGFSPRLSGGTVNPSAGSFSPVVTNLTRESGEENLAGLEVGMPPGVLARVAGVPLCPDSQAVTGECPASSQVGTTTVAAGPGPSPLWIPQPGKAPTAVYLAGPYAGGPYSLVVKTPAQAGPFDLGNVVVRAPIHVDPETTKVTVKSDPLPQILEGVPISYRTVHVDVNRPEFTLNPTSCEPMVVTGTATSISGHTAGLSDRFQVGSCERLGFKPKLSMHLTGKTHRGAFPAFHAVLKMPKGGANIARASVRLPHSEFLANAHIRTICTRVQFAEENCPQKSIYGHAVAKTPLLDQPLSGPVYLRSSSHELPDLVADLHGQIHVVLDGRIDSVHGGIRSVFEAVPDAPVSQFTLDMQGGAKGLLTNSTGLCLAPHLAVTSFTAQNGRLQKARVPLESECGKGGKGRRR
jgi:hypothetical protein